MNIKAYLLLPFFTMLMNQPIDATLKKSESIVPISNDWKMKQTDAGQWISAEVPGCVHSDLLRNRLIPEPYFRTNEKELQWIDKKDWEYKTTFQIAPEQLLKSRHELVFEGLDTYADVYLNGQLILSADNMFKKWEVDVKPFLKEGANELVILFHSPITKGLQLLKAHGYHLQAVNDQSINGGLQKDEHVSPFIRKAPYHFGWDWGPRFVTSGIWKPIYLRTWDDVRIADFYLHQESLTDQLAKISGQLEINSTVEQEAELAISTGANSLAHKRVQLKKGVNVIEIPFQIKQPKRWWSNGLGEPYLYKIEAKVNVKNTSHVVTREVGLRTLRLITSPDSLGHNFYFELNGVPVFAKGENHIPNDMFLDKVTKSVYEWEIETAVKSNLNMLRVWGGGIYEDDYFYQLCDRRGILVWQDFMFACSLYPGDNKFLKSISEEAEYQVKRLRNHPSIALWCGNNEIDIAWQNYNPNGDWGWKKAYTEDQRKEVWAAYDTIFNHILREKVAQFSPSSPYWQSSPASIESKQHANDKNANGDVHYWGVWWGKHPFEKYADNIGRFMSEYGFQSFPEIETVRKYALPVDYDIESDVMRHHQRSSIGNVTIKEYMEMYYKKPKSFEMFLYVGQVLQAYGIRFAIESHRRAMPYNMGSLVWQINDCWPVASWSSCDYYKRWKALQYEIKRSFEPIALSVAESNGESKVVVVSDRLTNITATLDMKLVDFSGKVLKTKTIEVVMNANAPTTLYSIATQQLVTRPNDAYWVLTLRKGADILNQKVHFFAAPKNLKLEQPEVTYQIKKFENRWEITLTSKLLAKDVWLNIEGSNGFFEDNYFDLLPGTSKKVVYHFKNGEKPSKQLAITSLYDAF